MDYSNGKSFTEIFGEIFVLEDCIDVKFNMTKWEWTLELRGTHLVVDDASIRTSTDPQCVVRGGL